MRKKLLSLILAFAMLCMIAPITVTSVAAENISVRINGSEISFDQPPLSINDRTMVPMRAIFEALGASVNWDDATQTAVSDMDGTTVIMTIGNNVMYVNSTPVALDTPAQIVNDRTLVPVRAIAEAFDCNVEWDGSTQTVDISTQNSGFSIPEDAFEYNGHYYYIYSGVCKTWDEAKEYCESLGGYLAVISSSEENDTLYNYSIDSGYKSVYFGYSDSEEEGTWEWVPNEFSNYTNWGSKEPNSENSKEDYAEFYYKYTSGEWNGGDFDAKNFICEWNPITIRALSVANYDDDNYTFTLAFQQSAQYATDAFKTLGVQIRSNIVSTNVLTDTIFKKMLANTFSENNDDDISLIYYSGHSFADILTTGIYKSSGGGLGFNEFYDMVKDNVKGTVVIFYDGCFAGKMIDESDLDERVKIIGSCDSDEEGTDYYINRMNNTFEFFDDVWGGGDICSLFSYALHNGTQSDLQVDMNSDGNVTFNELYIYLKNETTRLADKIDGYINEEGDAHETVVCYPEGDTTVIF